MEADDISFNKTAVAACKGRIAATGVAGHNLAEAQLVVHCKNRKFAEGIESAVRRIGLD